MKWSHAAIERLNDARLCPLCELSHLAAGHCAHCGADLSGSQGATLWNASVAAAEALRTREALLATVPRGAPVPVAAAAAQQMRAPQTGRESSMSASVAPRPLPPVPSAAHGASLQSVLAIAGASLFAVAAIVFTFFNPELADRAVRSWIIGGVSLAFLGGAWLLARRRLQASAEAVGGLGLVFVGLDVQAVAGSFHDDPTSWSAAALATAVAGGLLLAAALRFRIRIWLWASLPALAAVPALVGFSVHDALASALLLAASGLAASGLLGLLPRFADRFPARPDAPRVADGAPPTRRPLLAEVVALTTVQIIVTILAIGRILLADVEPLAVALVLAVLAGHALLAASRAIPGEWAVAAGVLAVSAGAFAGASTTAVLPTGVPWGLVVVPAGAVLALLLCAVVPLTRGTPRIPLAVGAGLAAGVTSAPAVLYAALVGSSLLRVAGLHTVVDGEIADVGALVGAATWPAILGLIVISGGFAAFGWLARTRSGIRPLRTAALVVAALYAIAAVLTLSGAHVMPRMISLAVLLAITAAVAVLISLRPRRGAVNVVLVVGAHLALLVAVLIAWQERALVPIAGVLTLAALAAVARTVPRPVRFLHAGAGYGYALALVATALSLVGVSGIAQLCLTASAGLLGAIAATFIPAIGARNWQAVLVVATVPFGIGVIQVIFERSGWTALSTGLMFVLALSLVLTRRAGLTVIIRTIAAGLLVPTLAVVILCLGAQLLVQSGSPVVLPIIAAVVALVLPSGRMIRDGLIVRGRIAAAADAARVAIEASALITGAIAVLLALVRDAAGFGTACLVLILLGIGAALTSLLAGRRYGWGVAGAAFTGALWSLWAVNGVQLPEAYLLPPALAAVLIAVLLALRGARAIPLFAAGLAGAIVPVLMLLIAGRGTGEVPWRAHALLASAWLLLALAAAVSRASGRRMRRLRPLRVPATVLASVAALGGTAQAVRWGTGLDRSPVLGGDAGLFLLCVGLSALAALALLVAAGMLRSAAPALRSGVRFGSSRMLTVPGALALGLGTWPAIATDWFVIWGMWTLMLGWLAVMVLAARRTSTTLPPVWGLFGIAFVTAVVAWSPRELRVEMFSLPLGLLLLAAGALGLRSAGGGADADGAAVTGATRWGAWPHGASGSWPLLAPGLVVMMSASVVSTFTDPLTWRAILVMVLALVAILVGAARRLAAPFVIGLIVLPVENVFVFAVQLGRGIESMPWWITLATIGAVLLIIAVAGERREGAGRSVVARMRDLR